MAITVQMIQLLTTAPKRVKTANTSAQDKKTSSDVKLLTPVEPRPQTTRGASVQQLQYVTRTAKEMSLSVQGELTRKPARSLTHVIPEEPTTKEISALRTALAIAQMMKLSVQVK